jgi:hypothetical protein
VRTLSLLLFAATFAAITTPRAPAADARVFYDITVTAPGTRSQGWRGVLYDPSGAPLARPAGSVVETNAGPFVSVACDWPWVPCGFIHEDQLRWMQTNGGNFILGRDTWVYRLTVTAPCTRSEGWRGELLRNGQAVRTKKRRVPTPMGPFRRKTSAHLWGQTGWFHAAWPAAVIAPGHWPCTAG